MNIRSLDQLQPKIADSAYVDETAVVIGDVTVGADASLWPMTVVRGDIHSIVIGARSNIQDGSILHVTHDSRFYPGGYPLVVGEEVTVGHRVILHGCTIEDRCLIGMGSTVMDGATLHSGLILGAASLVPSGKELEGGYLWMGSPVRRVRPLKASEQEYLQYAARHYMTLKDRHRRAALGST